MEHLRRQNESDTEDTTTGQARGRQRTVIIISSDGRGSKRHLHKGDRRGADPTTATKGACLYKAMPVPAR